MHGDKRNRTIFVFNLLVRHALSQLCLLYCSKWSFPFFANWRASLSAFTFFWRFGSSNRYIGNRSNQRWISQERSVRQYAPIPAASFLAEDATARVNLLLALRPLAVAFETAQRVSTTNWRREVLKSKSAP
jgi:hypothetical protein